MVTNKYITKIASVIMAVAVIVCLRLFRKDTGGLWQGYGDNGV